MTNVESGDGIAAKSIQLPRTASSNPNASLWFSAVNVSPSSQGSSFLSIPCPNKKFDKLFRLEHNCLDMDRDLLKLKEGQNCAHKRSQLLKRCFERLLKWEWRLSKPPPSITLDTHSHSANSLSLCCCVVASLSCLKGSSGCGDVSSVGILRCAQDDGTLG